MSENSSGKTPLYLRLIVRFVGNCAIVWALSVYLSQYFVLTGGVGAYVTVGALLTLLNIFVRPILAIITFPLKLFATILAIILVNGIFVQLTSQIVQGMDDSIVTLTISGGLIGWTVVALALGIGNWVMKEVLK